MHTFTFKMALPFWLELLLKVLFAFPSLVYLTAVASTPMVIDKVFPEETQRPMLVGATPAVPASADPLIACWLASFDSCPPPVLPFFADMLSCLSPGTQQLTPALFSGVLQQVEPAPLHLGPDAQIHFNLLSRLCNIPFALTAKIHLFRWAILAGASTPSPPIFGITSSNKKNGVTPLMPSFTFLPHPIPRPITTKLIFLYGARSGPQIPLLGTPSPFATARMVSMVCRWSLFRNTRLHSIVTGRRC